ncbi:murein hydrolase activator EnvC family protein [Anoxynatronum buryatiense]|uniref:Septal ring factor EnvC, activator of murein hydrolases AmiA and AmiB n=1 Tax=Anoxynatronum buryatiense TaxID=489973 RepID=A0AA45WU28_9CLOT|nr:M23 family metallopeptidase [Anoxynatronum buryatiense]SMP45329.1 Septal ring factor EnvC, activator of murein hydrolases AmiA and AmiB [Anoxynatronum buryatiense]
MQHQKIIKTITYMLMAGLLLSTTTTFGNDEINQVNRELERLQQQQKGITSELKENESQQRDVSAEISKIGTAIANTQNEISSLQQQITDTETRIAHAEDELVLAAMQIDEKKDLLARRLDAMYRSGNVAYAEVLFNSRDFTELMSNLDMVQTIVNYDVELLQFLDEQRMIVEDRKAELEAGRRHLSELQLAMENQRSVLLVSRGEQERLKQELEEDKVALARQLDQLEKEAKDLEQVLLKLQSEGDYIGGVMKWPVPGHTRVSSEYGNRLHPILKTNRFHSGIDIPAPTGTNIIAAGSGRVAFAGTQGGYGRTVILDHGGGIMSLYAHNSQLLVSEGQQVTQGSVIAKAGSTGMSTGPHLHFEVRENGKYVDPNPWIGR